MTTTPAAALVPADASKLTLARDLLLEADAPGLPPERQRRLLRVGCDLLSLVIEGGRTTLVTTLETDGTVLLDFPVERVSFVVSRECLSAPARAALAGVLGRPELAANGHEVVTRPVAKPAAPPECY